MNASLPRTSSRNARKVDDVTWLNSQIILPGSLWRKVFGRVGLGLPQVPDGDIGKVVSSEGDAGFACILEDDGAVDGDWCVNAVRFIGDGHGVGLLGNDLVCLRLVLVCAAFEARDGGLGDVLADAKG